MVIGFGAMSQQVFVQADGSATWGLNGRCESAEIPVFIVNPEGGKSAAVQTVIDNVPETYDGLPLTKVRFDSYDSEGNLNMVAVYEESSGSASDEDVADEEESSLSFNCGATAIHITEAYSQRRILGRKDAGNVIGWNGKGGDEMQVEGVDVQTGECRETYTKDIRVSKLTNEYRRKLWRLVGKVNKTKYLGWEAGELMFMGANFTAPGKDTKDGEKTVTVTFDFVVRENEKNFDYEGVKVSKKGFDYVWSIKKSNKGEEGYPKATIEAAYVAQVVKYADFSVLGL
jgi:hypothetical protein